MLVLGYAALAAQLAMLEALALPVATLALQSLTLGRASVTTKLQDLDLSLVHGQTLYLALASQLTIPLPVTQNLLLALPLSLVLAPV